MSILIVFFIIFVGVTIALYQVYEVNYNINFGNEKKLSQANNIRLAELSAKAKASTQTPARSDFDQAAASVFGPKLDREMALAAFSEEKQSTYAIPLLRRKERLVYNGDIKVRHLPFWKTKLPSVDVRGLLIILVIINCFLAQLLGGMSIYTINYKFSMPSLLWLNDPFILMLVICALIFMTYVISKLDMYMNDIYQIGKLSKNRMMSVGEAGV